MGTHDWSPGGRKVSIGKSFLCANAIARLPLTSGYYGHILYSRYLDATCNMPQVPLQYRFGK